MSTLTIKVEPWMLDEEGNFITDEDLYHKKMNEHYREKYGGLSRPILGTAIFNLADPRWALKNLIQEEGITMIHGSPASGKSLMAMDWAYTLAHPDLTNWMGQEKLKTYKPMYIFTEGFSGLKPRSEAWMKQRGVTIPGTEQERDGVLWVRDAVRLNRQDNEDNPWSEQVAALHQMYLDYDRDILFVDTLANTFVGNENSQQDANNYLAALRMFQSYGPVVVVHHNQKEGKQFRGSTVFEGAVDTKVATEASNGVVRLYVTKQKDGDPGFYLNMRLKPIDLTAGREYEVSSVVLEETQIENKITKKQAQILSILSEGPMSTEVIAHHREGSLESTSNMLNRMEEVGLVSQDETTLAWTSHLEAQPEVEEL